MAVSILEQGSTHRNGSGCSCPVCLGLKCLERPRFFSGQLLTESELNGEQSYVLAKNRLHNRYLHGWGVVCGLQVVCDECDGWVQVKPGYAIDPCGNDVLVCANQSFDVLKAIRECRDGGRPRRSDCEPYRPMTQQDCKDVEQTWCLTIQYRETEARPIAALRSANVSCACNPGCSCGSRGHGDCGCRPGCGCGNGNGNGGATSSYGSGGAVSSAMQTKPWTGTQLAACEPTRIYETYRLELCEAPPGHCMDLSGRLENTLFARILGCVETVSGFFERRVGKESMLVGVSAFFGKSGSYSAPTQYEACCRLKEAVRALFAQDPLNVRCDLTSTLDQIDCDSPSEDDGESYAPKAEASIGHLGALILQYLLDCICMNLLSPCDPDPGDDRLVLACLTVLDDKVVRICNFGCRHYAGSFPAVSYWLSLIPIIPVIGWLVTQLCCGDDLVRARSPLVNRLSDFLTRVDPTGSLRDAASTNDFALPKRYASQFSALVKRVSPAALARLVPTEGVALSSLVDRGVGSARSELRKNGVDFVEEKIASTDGLPIRALIAPLIAAPGHRVVLYTHANRVVGYAAAPAKPAAPTAEPAKAPTRGGRSSSREVTSLKRDLAAMQARLDRLEGGDQKAPPSARPARARKATGAGRTAKAESSAPAERRPRGSRRSRS